MDGQGEQADPPRDALAAGFYERFFDVALEMFAALGFDGTFLRANAAWERWLGWTEEDLRSMPYVSLFHPDDVAENLAEIAKLALGGETLDYQTRLRAKDGVYHRLWGSAESDPEAGVFYVVVREVDSRQQADAARRDAEERLRFQLALEGFVTFFSTRILATLGDALEETIHDALAGISAIFGLDHAYVLIVDWNSLRLELFQEWWGDGVDQVSIPINELPGAAGRFWLAKLESGEAVHLPTLDAAPAGSEAAVVALEAEGVKSILFLPLRAGDIPVGFFGFEARREPTAWTEDGIALMRTVGELFVGAIERRRAQRALTAAAAELEKRNTELERSNRDLEDFASIASHDLKSPLPVVRGFVELLGKAAREAVAGEGQVSVEEVDNYVGAVVRGVNRMRDLIDDLLSYAHARRGPAERGPVDLDPLVRQLASEVLPGGTALRIDPLPTVSGERAQLGQLFQNLLTNAAKFHAPDRAPEVDVTTTREGDCWHIAVEDRGVGVAAENRERIFEMFTRVAGKDHVPGTGIGLAVCARVAESHGGRIWVEERAGGGSRFVVALPGS